MKRGERDRAPYSLLRGTANHSPPHSTTPGSCSLTFPPAASLALPAARKFSARSQAFKPPVRRVTGVREIHRASLSCPIRGHTRINMISRFPGSCTLPAMRLSYTPVFFNPSGGGRGLETTKSRRPVLRRCSRGSGSENSLTLGKYKVEELFYASQCMCFESALPALRGPWVAGSPPSQLSL